MSTTTKTSTQAELERVQRRPEAIDYAERKRNLEWRRNWFYGIRSQDTSGSLKPGWPGYARSGR